MDDWVVLRLTPLGGRPLVDAGGTVTCRAEQGLARLGLSRSFFPRMRCRIVRRGKRHWRVSELFPRYGFLVKDEHWQVARDDPGVMGFAMDGDSPGTLPGSEVDRVQTYLDKFGYVQMTPQERFTMLQRVLMRVGHTADIIGLYEGLGRPGKAIVSYELFGRRVRTEVHEGDLVAA